MLTRIHYIPDLLQGNVPVNKLVNALLRYQWSLFERDCPEFCNKLTRQVRKFKFPVFKHFLLLYVYFCTFFCSASFEQVFLEMSLMSIDDQYKIKIIHLIVVVVLSRKSFHNLAWFAVLKLKIGNAHILYQDFNSDWFWTIIN